MTGAELSDEIERLFAASLSAHEAYAASEGDSNAAVLADESWNTLTRALVRHKSAILAALRSERPAVDEGALERATVASYNSFFESQIGCCEPSWDELPDSHKDRMRDATRAALAAAQEGSNAGR